MIASGVHAGTLTSATFAGFFVVSTETGGLLASGTPSPTGVSVSLVVTPQSTVRIQGSLPSLDIRYVLSGSQQVLLSSGIAAADRGLWGQIELDLRGIPSPYRHLFTVPLSIGHSTVQTMMAYNPLAGSIEVTVSNLAWRTSAFTYQATGTLQATPIFPGPQGALFTAQGHNGLTANGGGILTLVAPVIVRQTVSGVRASSATAATLTLNFVPEPTTGTNLAVGLIVASALMVARRDGSSR